VSAESASENRKTVTIRGLSAELYERVTRVAREMGVTVGEFVNEALKQYISVLEGISKTLDNIVKSGDVLVISNVSSLVVTRKDLEGVSKGIIFKDMDELVLADDVTSDLFLEKIVKIINVNTVYVPKTLSTLLVASRCELVKKITSRS
jgi:predicted DNA-binding protein